MDVLFIGGTGRLSKDTAALASQCGLNVTLLTRGSSDRAIFAPTNCELLQGNIRDKGACRQLLSGRKFDVVVDYLSYTTPQLENTLNTVLGHCLQFVFISSATVYKPCSDNTLISEKSSAIGNQEWQYAWDKFLCEKFLAEYSKENGIEYTIVRPYVTYGNTRVPYPLVPFDNSKEWSFVERIRLGLPIPTFDGGCTQTTLTHTKDFAKGMVGLFGNDLAYGEDFHITNDEHVTWNTAIDALEGALGLKAVRIDVPREHLYKKMPEYKSVVEGDKGRIMRFDSSKIRAAVPSFSCEIKLVDGIADMIEFYEGHPELKRIDWIWMGKMDRLLLGKKEARSTRALYDFHTPENKMRYILGYYGALENIVKWPKKALERLK